MQVQVPNFRGMSNSLNDNVAGLAQNSVSASGLSNAGIEIYGVLTGTGWESGKE